MDPQQLREDLLEADEPEMVRRRAVIGLSLVGVAAMVPVSLLQAGIVKHLPDVSGFRSDETILSDAAYLFLGAPDGPVALASLAANLPLAAAGGRQRSRRRPWISLLVGTKALVDAIGAGIYFSRMAAGKEPWCLYCVTGAIANFSILAVAMPEATAAMNNLIGPRQGYIAAPKRG